MLEHKCSVPLKNSVDDDRRALLVGLRTRLTVLKAPWRSVSNFYNRDKIFSFNSCLVVSKAGVKYFIGDL